MFDALFTYPKVLARHQAGPAAEEREQYLAHRARDEGIASATLKRIARELLIVARWIDLSNGRPVTPQDIDAAAQRWASHQLRRGRSVGEWWSRRLFVQIATSWLCFLGRLAEPSGESDDLAADVEYFTAYLRDVRGLSPTTIRTRRWYVECFLQTVRRSKDSTSQITIADIDAFLSLKGKEGWRRVSVAASASALRTFFRHAAMRGWCRPGIAMAIDSPRLFKHEGLPSGPTWNDVQRLVASTGGTNPHDIRDHAILMLFAVYGLRSGEVRKLRLENLDWTNEVITVERPKQRRTQYYPLVTSLGEAILQYLKHARPHCTRRELFVTFNAPIRPLSPSGMYNVVSKRIERLGIQTPQHHGPHCLRHACASHLVVAGLNLKEIGDHLGHRSANATRIYAKVDLTSLREVADFDLRGLI